MLQLDDDVSTWLAIEHSSGRSVGGHLRACVRECVHVLSVCEVRTLDGGGGGGGGGGQPLGSPHEPRLRSSSSGYASGLEFCLLP